MTALVLVACGVARSEFGERPEKADKQERGTIYSPIGKRDPFKPPSLDALGRSDAALNPLERFSIEQFQLRAILRGLGRSRAMLEDPEGRTYIISDGDIVGREHATVSRVLNTGVVLTERTFNYLGQESLYEKVLSLPQNHDEGTIEEVGGRRGRKGNDANAMDLNAPPQGFMPQNFNPPKAGPDMGGGGFAPPAPVQAAPAANAAPPVPAAAPAGAAPAAAAPLAGANAAPAAPPANAGPPPTITNRGGNGGLTY